MVDEHYDIVVIGGGAVGASTAFALSESDRTVCLIEADRIASGATGRSVGGVRQQFSDSLRTRLMIESRATFDELAARSRRISVTETGYLFLARTNAQAESLAADHRLHRSLGLRSTLVEPAELHSFVPALRTEDLVIGKFCPTDCVIDPHAVTTWLAEQAVANGVTLRERTHVRSVSVVDGVTAGVSTDGGDISASTVIVAAGVGSADLLADIGIELALRPTRIYAAVTDESSSLLAGQPFTVDIDRRMYFRPEGTHSLVIGGSIPRDVSGCRASIDMPTESTTASSSCSHAGTRAGSSSPAGAGSSDHHAFLTATASFMHERTDGFEDLGVRNWWSGVKGVTPDGLPYVGPHTDVGGLYVATGFNGHGVMLAPVIGEQLATHVLDGTWGEFDLSAFSPTRSATTGSRATDHPGFMGVSTETTDTD